jgi:hypothetical protein
MNQLKSFFSSFFERFLKNRIVEWGLYLASYLLPTGIFFLILFATQVPVDMTMMVIRIIIFIFIFDLPFLWASQRPLKQSIFFTLSIFAIVFGVGLKFIWQNEGALFVNQATYSTIGGLLPWLDANGYLSNARTFLYGSPVPLYTAISARVLFVSTLSTLLGITGQNLQLVAALFCLACLYSCYFLVREIKAAFGLFPAFTGFILLSTYYIYFAGTLLSELEGFAFGAIACALLLNGTREKKPLPIWLGLFCLTMAINARPGAFFIFPALLLWPILYKKDPLMNKRFWWGCLISIGLGFGINLLFSQWLAVKTSGNYAAFPVLLLGLVSGGISPDLLIRQHPEISIILNDASTAQKTYQLIFDTFRSNPAGLLLGITKSYLDYFESSGTFSFIKGANRIIILAMDLFFIGGIIAGLISFKKSYKNIWAMAGLGIILTVPIVNYVGFRAYAATIPVLIILVCLAVHSILTAFKIDPKIDSTPSSHYGRDSMIYAAMILSVIIVGPITIRLFSRLPDIPPVTCPADQVASTVFWSKGSYIQFVPDYQINASSLPTVRISDFKKNLVIIDDSPFFDEMKKMQENHYLLNAYDIHRGAAFWLVMDQNQAPAANGYIGVCGKDRNGTGIMDAISVTPIQ